MTSIVSCFVQVSYFKANWPRKKATVWGSKEIFLDYITRNVELSWKCRCNAVIFIEYEEVLENLIPQRNLCRRFSHFPWLSPLVTTGGHGFDALMNLKKWLSSICNNSFEEWVQWPLLKAEVLRNCDHMTIIKSRKQIQRDRSEISLFTKLLFPVTKLSKFHFVDF